MRVFMLDLSKCKGKYLDGYDQSIPCKIGEFGRNLDVIEDRIDPDVLATWRKEGRKTLEAQGILALEDAPVGFDIRTMPVGATITVVEEEEA